MIVCPWEIYLQYGDKKILEENYGAMCAFVEFLDKNAKDGICTAWSYGALLTGLGVYDDLARFAGAGSLVPITGFANSVVSPALEFKTEGFVTGTAVKIFTIAGPVIVYGIGASVIYGLILAVFGLV